MDSAERRRFAALVWASGLLLFIAMSASASAHNTFPGDVWLTMRIQDFDWTPWVNAMDVTEDFAQMPLIAVTTFGASLAALLLMGPLSAVLIVLTLFFRPIVPLVKEIVERPRPSPGDVVVAPGQPADFSFPSGHAFAAMLLYGLCFYLATVHVKNPWVRLPIQIICVWLIIVTGVERVYSGSHWPSDVAGGYLLGLLCAAILISLPPVVNNRRAR
jgi:undecaprenyl-diphosphatase